PAHGGFGIGRHMSTTGSDDRYLLVHAYCDGELDPVNAKALEQQISADPTLAAERDRIMALRRALHDQLPGQRMPAGVRDRAEKTAGIKTLNFISNWNAIAASILVAVMISVVATLYVPGRSNGS